jgi:Protein of unknown function (DUF1579)
MTPKDLEVFVGKWKKTGRAHESPFGPAATVTAVETFDWLEGEKFLIHRLDGRLGDEAIACIEIIGLDPSSGGYAAHSFYNDGATNVWQVSHRDDTWLYSGSWNREGHALKVRCRLSFDDPDTLAARWEYSGGGNRWQIFWDTTLTRA